jgi:DNA repair protein RecO (recombination protein O)
VLHSYPYKETSLIVDVLHARPRPHRPGGQGRQAAAFGKLRGVLQTFPAAVGGWTGKSEVRTLTGGRMARRPAATGKVGAAVRLLSQ